MQKGKISFENESEAFIGKPTDFNEKCGCGKATRYFSIDGKSSCNKYRRCPSYEELEKVADKLLRLVRATENAFITCTGGDECFVKVKFDDLQSTQEFHEALLLAIKGGD